MWDGIELARGEPLGGLVRLLGETQTVQLTDEEANAAQQESYLKAQEHLPEERVLHLKCSGSPATLKEWHSALGHLSVENIRKMASMVDGLEGVDLSGELGACDACSQGRMTRVSFQSPSNAYRATERLDLIHSDLCGPFRLPSLQGSRYFITYPDEHSAFCWVDFLPDKEASTILHSFRNWQSQVEK